MTLDHYLDLAKIEEKFFFAAINELRLSRKSVESSLGLEPESINRTRMLNGTRTENNHKTLSNLKKLESCARRLQLENKILTRPWSESCK